MGVFIEADGLGLELPVYTQAARSAKATLGVLARAAFHPPKREVRKILDSVSFRLEAGDRLGIIGRNGAGKSTLLKVLVGAYPPSCGQLRVSGRRQALLNLNLGFLPEATLVENVLLRGIAMGLKQRQAAAILDEVLDFSELGVKAGDRLHTLSSGQRMRLGFALATSIQHEILIMDEWIGAGDAAFVEKAKGRMKSRVDNAEIVVVASHNLQLLRSVCTKVLHVEEGRQQFLGPVEDALKSYTQFVSHAQSEQSVEVG